MLKLIQEVGKMNIVTEIRKRFTGKFQFIEYKYILQHTRLLWLIDYISLPCFLNFYNLEL